MPSRPCRPKPAGRRASATTGRAPTRPGTNWTCKPWARIWRATRPRRSVTARCATTSPRWRRSLPPPISMRPPVSARICPGMNLTCTWWKARASRKNLPPTTNWATPGITAPTPSSCISPCWRSRSRCMACPPPCAASCAACSSGWGRSSPQLLCCGRWSSWRSRSLPFRRRPSTPTRTGWAKPGTGTRAQPSRTLTGRWRPNPITPTPCTSAATPTTPTGTTSPRWRITRPRKKRDGATPTSAGILAGLITWSAVSTTQWTPTAAS